MTDTTPTSEWAKTVAQAEQELPYDLSSADVNWEDLPAGAATYGQLEEIIDSFESAKDLAEQGQEAVRERLARFPDYSAWSHAQMLERAATRLERRAEALAAAPKDGPAPWPVMSISDKERWTNGGRQQMTEEANSAVGEALSTAAQGFRTYLALDGVSDRDAEEQLTEIISRQRVWAEIIYGPGALII